MPPLKILKKTGFEWDPQPVRHGVQRSFLKFNPLLLVLLTFKIIYQGQGQH